MHENINWHERFVQQLNSQKIFREKIYNEIASYTKTNISASSNILEIGCGTCALLKEIACKYNANIYGVDIDENRLEEGKKYLKQYRIDCNLEIMDIHELKFPSNKFDLVFSNLVFLWIRNSKKAFDEIWRIMKTHSLFIIFSEPDYGGFIEYPDTGLKPAFINSLVSEGADPFIGRKLPSFFKGFKILNQYSINQPWLAFNDSKNLEKELAFLRNLLKDSFDYRKMRISILSGFYFLYMPVFSYILEKV
ncbi:MAG: class I SAM-dependent methyltransferase [Promethearchaeota archaeon]